MEMGLRICYNRSLKLSGDKRDIVSNVIVGGILSFTDQSLPTWSSFQAMGMWDQLLTCYELLQSVQPSSYDTSRNHKLSYGGVGQSDSNVVCILPKKHRPKASVNLGIL